MLTRFENNDGLESEDHAVFEHENYTFIFHNTEDEVTLIDSLTSESFFNLQKIRNLLNLPDLILSPPDRLFNNYPLYGTEKLIDLAVEQVARFRSVRCTVVMDNLFHLGCRGGLKDYIRDYDKFPVDYNRTFKLCQSIYCAENGKKNKKEPPKPIAKPRIRTKTLTERDVQDYLKADRNGQTEVQTKFGYIDLLTKDSLIEIKAADNWKSGIGQLLSYGSEYPQHRKVLYLFGSTRKLILSDIKFILANLDITLEVHPK